MSTITDWLMVVITAVYVIATIFICRANIKSAKATKEQIVESKRQFDETNRPFITVTFEVLCNGFAVLCIANHGMQIANNVEIKINSEFINNIPDESGKKYTEKLCTSSFTLGIDQSWHLFLCTSPKIKDMDVKILHIDISYSDNSGYEGKQYHEETLIDLDQYTWAMMDQSYIRDASKSMKKIAENVHSIDKSLKKIKDKISIENQEDI